MPKYVRERPIILYSNLDDQPDRTKDDVRGISDESILEDVKVVITRPGGDRHSTLIPRMKTIEGFGNWWVADLNLNFTDELGEWGIKWIYKTSTGEVVDNYVIHIVESNLVPVWCFQPLSDKTLPQDVKDLMSEDNV